LNEFLHNLAQKLNTLQETFPHHSMNWELNAPTLKGYTAFFDSSL